MATVTLHDVRKTYENGFAAVHGVDLEVADGEFVVLVGPSGCGKSTTLRMIAGLESITAGTLRIGDRVVNDVPPKDRDIAMVFQSYALYPHMTVRENMAFALQLRKLPKREIEQRVGQAAGILGLEDVLDRRPKQLSGGQRQRVAVGRAIVRQPQVFLFDEPLSNLDAKLRVQTRREITHLHRRLAATMIYVTHDQVEAMTMGDRIVVMNAGRVEQIDTPMALYARPATLFVAGFIGSPAMNFLAGTIQRRDGLHFHTEGDGPRLLVPDAWAPVLAGREGEPLVLGIRPEHIAVAPADDGAIAARLDLVEPMGHETIVHARAGAIALTARIAPQPLPEPGAPIALRPDPAHLHFFDARAERALAPVS
jgi:multiple sugar transport system ATP-binding protein